MDWLVDAFNWTIPVAGGGLLMREVLGNVFGLASALGGMARKVADPVHRRVQILVQRRVVGVQRDAGHDRVVLLGQSHRLGRAWVRIATKVPVLTIIVVVLGIGALAIPARDLELALPDQGTEEEGTSARDTYDLITEEFGPGYNGPLLVTADIINTDDPLAVVEDLEDRITALDGANFEARPGQLTFIVGESGSGKSTLLSAAAGLITPDSGSVLLDDTEVTDRVRLDKIGMIFQQANLIAALNVRDQLLVTDHIRGVKPRRDRAEELLATVGLEGLGDRRIGEMSGGQRQRVGIARALMGEPELLLADEPTASLDADRSQEIVALLRELATERDIACGFVTHDRSLIESSDEVFEMGVSAPAYA